MKKITIKTTYKMNFFMFRYVKNSRLNQYHMKLRECLLQFRSDVFVFQNPIKYFKGQNICTIVPAVVSYRSETWSVAVREVGSDSLRLDLEQRKWEEEKRGCGKLHSDNLHNLYPSTNITGLSNQNKWDKRAIHNDWNWWQI